MGNPRAKTEEEVIILHTNDLHFNFNHGEKLYKLINNFRLNYENVILLNGGDSFLRSREYWPEGGLEFYKNRCLYMIKAMNEAGYDAAVLGNNELDFKGTVTRDALGRARFRLLGANVKVNTDKFDQPEPYALFKTPRGGIIGVLGLSPPGENYPDGIEVETPEETLQGFRYLREKCDILVLLSHLGEKKDRRLAEEFGWADVIIGGQSHTEINPARIVNGVLICQTSGHHPGSLNPDAPHSLGVIRIMLNRQGKALQKKGEVLNIDARSRIQGI